MWFSWLGAEVMRPDCERLACYPNLDLKTAVAVGINDGAEVAEDAELDDAVLSNGPLVVWVAPDSWG